MVSCVPSAKLSNSLSSDDWKSLLKENIYLDLPRSAWYHLWIKSYLLLAIIHIAKGQFHQAQLQYEEALQGLCRE